MLAGVWSVHGDGVQLIGRACTLESLGICVRRMKDIINTHKVTFRDFGQAGSICDNIRCLEPIDVELRLWLLPKLGEDLAAEAVYLRGSC